MKIHVVTNKQSDNRILPRLAKYLAIYNDWSMSLEPDVSADFNYFNNYGTYAQQCNGWHGTPMGAYFSHLDTTKADKERQWYDVAKIMDVCTTTARMYNEFLPAENVYQCRPPVEIDRFTIAKTLQGKKPVVGVSGFVYGDGRKGEELWRQFITSSLSSRLELRAAGRGWPGVKTRYYKWNNLHEFFQSLDVLVVPSLFEGIPMPPLEALACGVKIVIPKDVGMLNDLPNVRGIYRYDRGNATAMIEAIEQATFSDVINREALREIILQNYTVQHWADDHKKMIADYFQQEDIENLPEWEGNAGVYVVAFGDPSRKCAERAIDSIHQYMPSLPVALVSNKKLGKEDIFIKHKDVDAGGRIAKLKCNDLAPGNWTYVLYVDADIEIIDDISFLFQILQDGWEFVI